MQKVSKYHSRSQLQVKPAALGVNCLYYKRAIFLGHIVVKREAICPIPYGLGIEDFFQDLVHHRYLQSGADASDRTGSARMSLRRTSSSSKRLLVSPPMPLSPFNAPSTSLMRPSSRA
jgi:hypothetical protein